MKNKKIVVSVLIALLLISIVGVTFAAYTYSRQGTSNSKQLVGDIYMHYTESNTLTLENAMPSNNYQDGKFFQFTIDGKNTNMKYDIWYDISLNHGDVPTGKTESNRIADEFLKFRLVEVVNNEETELIASNSYDDLTNKRIYAATIPKNTTSQVSHTYRIYMWISNDVVIGNVDQDYTESEWNNLFASIKVNVTGDFTEKEVARPFNQIIQTSTKDTGIKFYEVNGTDNGNGLYMMESTENDTYPIYYYRGNVDNNNVYFAGYCWKIVRTTSTGGLKLVYNGTADTVNGEKQCNQTTGTGTRLSVGEKAFNSSYNSPAYVGYSLPATSSRYSYSTETLNGATYYGSSVDQTTYKLVDAQDHIDNDHHYSYNSADPDATGISGDTGNVRYYYYKKSADNTSGTGYYIKFDKTKNISTILNEMLSESNSKNNPSNIQGVINTWWGSLDATYGEFLEDTEWCNDRSIASLGGWAEDGTLYSSNWYDYSIVFNERVRYDQSTFGSNPNNIKNTNTPILTCSRSVDRLSVANGNLTYPIGLLTYDELVLAGAIWSNGNSNFYLYTNQYYWLLSPFWFSYYNAFVGLVYSGGNLSNINVNDSRGVRPALSLKHGTQIIKGEGTKAKPYIITET